MQGTVHFSCFSFDLLIPVSTEEECVIIEPELRAAPPAADCQSLSQSTKEVANSLLHLCTSVSSNNASTVATQLSVAMETEGDVTVAAELGKTVMDEQEGDMSEGGLSNRAPVVEELSVLRKDIAAEECQVRSNHVSQENQPSLSKAVHFDVIRDEMEGKGMATPTQQGEEEEGGDKRDEEDHNEAKPILPVSNVPSVIHTITSTAAAQETHTEAQNHETSLEDYKSHRARPLGNQNSNSSSPLNKYDSHKCRPLHNYETSPPLSYSSHRACPLQDYSSNVEGENYKIGEASASASAPTSPDIIEVHSDKSEEKFFDDMEGDDDEDSLSQRSTVTEESEMFDITRGNLGLLEQAIALKAEQVKPAVPRELLCTPDIHHQRFITMDDRPKHMDAIRKSYLSKGKVE